MDPFLPLNLQKKPPDQLNAVPNGFFNHLTRLNRVKPSYPPRQNHTPGTL